MMSRPLNDQELAEWYRFLLDYTREARTLLPDPMQRDIMRAVLAGYFEGRPYTATSLAAELEAPHQRVMRHVRRLQEEGHLTTYKQNRAWVIVPSEAALEHIRSDKGCRLRRFAGRWQTMIEQMQKNEV